MFMPNDVHSLESQRIRVLWSNRHAIFWIDIDDEKALPKLSPRDELEHLMASGELTAIADPYLNLSMNSPKPGSPAEKVQKRAWEAIKDIVIKEPEIYQRASRGPLLSTVLERTGSTKQTVYRWLRRYWQLGKCKNAVSGRYHLCGGAGIPKTLGDKKMGAPRTRMPGIGINVDDQVKALFRVAIEKFLLHEGEYELDYAYNQVLIAFGVPLPCKPEDLINVPTERQFRYFYAKEYSPIEITKSERERLTTRKTFVLYWAHRHRRLPDREAGTKSMPLLRMSIWFQSRIGKRSSGAQRFIL